MSDQPKLKASTRTMTTDGGDVHIVIVEARMGTIIVGKDSVIVRMFADNPDHAQRIVDAVNTPRMQ